MNTLDTALTQLSKKFRIDLHYFLKGGFWLVLTQGITVLGSLVVATIFSNKLSTSDYGVYRYLVALAILFTTFSLTGIGPSVLQTVSKGYREFFPYAIKISLIYNLGITITSFIGAVYYFLNNNYILATGCILIGFIQPAINAYQNVVPFLQGLKLFKKSALMQIFKVLFITIVSAITVFVTHNLVILFFTFLISQVLANTLASFIFSHDIDKSQKLDDQIRQRYLRYAQNTSLRNIVTGLATRLDNILVFQYLGASNLAIFSITTILPDQVKGAFKNLFTLIIPRFAKYESIGQQRQQILNRTIHLLILLVIVSISIAIILPFVYSFLFPKYPTAIIYAQFLLLGLPASIDIIPSAALQSHLKEKELYGIDIYTSIFQIISTFTLIYFLGLTGAVLARISSRYVSMAITFFYVYKSN